MLLDATLVRMVVVPATMELLGERNWWLPNWLDRLLPHIEIEPVEPALPAPVVAGSGTDAEAGPAATRVHVVVPA